MAQAPVCAFSVPISHGEMIKCIGVLTISPAKSNTFDMGNKNKAKVEQRMAAGPKKLKKR